MSEIIRVTTAKNNNQVVLWEVHEDHPGGEVWIVGDGQAYAVALTPRVRERLNNHTLLRIESDPEPIEGYDDMTATEIVTLVDTLTGDEKAAIAEYEGYDDMTATEIVALIDTLTGDEKAAIAEYEAAHKNRSTVLKALE